MKNDTVTAAQAVRILSPITSNDASRPMLGCVHFEPCGGGAWMAVATDSYMMAWIPCSSPYTDGTDTPVDVSHAIVAALTAKDVALAVSDGRVVVTSKDHSTRSYDNPDLGNYPNWHTFRDMGNCDNPPSRICLNMNLLDNWRKAAKAYLGLHGRAKDLPTVFSWVGRSDSPIARLDTEDLHGILMAIREPTNR